MLFVGGIALLGCVGGMQPVGWSGVNIADSTLFVGSREGRLVAIQPDDTRLWSEPLKAPPSGGFGCAPITGGGGFGCPSSGAPAVAIYGTPVVAGDLAYVTGYNGKVYAFNSSTLQLRWLYPREDYLKPIVGGLAVASNKVYFGDSDGKVY